MNFRSTIICISLYIYKKRNRNRTAPTLVVVHIRSQALKTFTGILSAWPALQESLESTSWKILYPGGLESKFMVPPLLAKESDVFALAFLHLLGKYVDGIPSSYVKITMGLEMESSISGSFGYTLGCAIPYVGESVEFSMAALRISQVVLEQVDKYQSASLNKIFVRAYYLVNESLAPLTFLEAKDDHLLVMKSLKDRLLLAPQPSPVELPLPVTLHQSSRKAPRPPFMTALPSSRTTETRRSFIVADFETVLVLIDDIQQPYAFYGSLPRNLFRH